LNPFVDGGSRDSSFNIVTRLGAGRPGFDSRLGEEFLSLPPGCKTAESWNCPLVSI